MSRADSLAALEAFDTLVVGPPVLESRRLICPYRIVRPGAEEVFNLIFRYPEEVFVPQEAASRRLAAMCAAQAALNYGLFCRRLRFRGLFSDPDRRFLRAMAENTAREILLNKLLAPNLFLRGLPDLGSPRPPFCRASLCFEPPGEAPASDENPFREALPRSYAVLSSGGKESLLSFALLRELGQPVHPFFINESGRHWYTALNAHRAFQRHIPHTARVWTNVDRLFVWFLHRLPFVRPDFSRLRADYYPIRLWTVPVLIFAALPLLHRRRLGRLIIGNEYDTSLRSRTAGLGHYGGLYDQSRDFDLALERYFREAGWNVRPFSLLRPLSELLIQKLLLERYPGLQRLQMSCHAAHLDEGRARPCGRCEKCRRIIAMLTALGADPSGSGYQPAQIESALIHLHHDHLHQESAGLAQILYLLGRRPRGRPEIMRLRFDPRRSPLTDLPEELQDGLLAIYLDHAEGALERRGRRWFSCATAEALGATTQHLKEARRYEEE